MELLRDLAPQVLGAVLRRFRDFAAAEDAVQEAFIAAASQWPHEGVPANPRGWLIQVALRRMTDHIRSEVARREREAEHALATPLVVAPEILVEPALDPEDTLVLLFMCCLPALPAASSIPLALRAVGGLTTAEIARAFMLPEATIAQRISRAKQTIEALDMPFELPGPLERDARLGAVMHVLYLIFNEGYATSYGAELQRDDLSHEAIRLTRNLHGLLPDHHEVMGLLALMLLTHARRHARTGASGELIPLDEQDRAQWDRSMIDEGLNLVTHALRRGGVGEYALLAAIAALHDEAANFDATDWPQIRALYETLQRIADNPMYALNHAVAVAMVDGPAAGLALLDSLAADPRIAAGHRLEAVRGHLYERAGDCVKSVASYRSAAGRATNTQERNFLLLRAARLAQTD